FALACLWPYQDRRLTVPLLLPMLLAVACLAHDLVGAAEPGRGTRTPRGRAAAAALGALALWAGAFSVGSVGRIAGGAAAAGYEVRARQLAGGLELMRGRVPAGAVVGAPELWPALPLLAGVRAA